MKKSNRSETKALEKLRLPELQARYAEVLGEATRCPNRTYLIRRISETLEARANVAASVDATLAETAPAAVGPAEAAPVETAREETAQNVPADVEPGTEAAETDSAAEAATDVAPSTEETRLSKLSVPELQALYLEVIGRPTGSSAKRYLVWKVTQARKGRIPVGPRGNRRVDGDAVDFKVLPLRMEADLVAQLDEARGRLGLKSRMELFRRSLHAFLLEAGEVRIAQIFAPEA